MKVAINASFGGFSLSRAGVKRLAELQGRQCYFFTNARDGGRIDVERYEPSDGPLEGCRDMFFSAFDIPNPNEVLKQDKPWHDMSDEEKKSSNALYEKHSFSNGRELHRTDPLLIQVIEELGEQADGTCAKLKIVEIPDGVDYVIDEYDGNETIHEKHRSWA